jgi:hypothetical protein
MTVVVVNDGIIKCIRKHTVLIRPMFELDVDIPRDSSRQDAMLTLEICYLLQTVSELDLDCVHHLSPALPNAIGIYCLPEVNQ